MLALVKGVLLCVIVSFILIRRTHESIMQKKGKLVTGKKAHWRKNQAGRDEMKQKLKQVL